MPLFNTFFCRFLETASVIEKNLSLFQSVCKHVDVVTTIIEYLTNFGVKLSLCSNFGTYVNISCNYKDILKLFL